MATKTQRQAGFTLVELLVTIAVATVLIIALNSVVNNYLHLAQRGRFLNLANSFAESQIETLRNQGFNSLALGTSSLTSNLPSQLPPGSSSTMTISQPSTGIDKVYLTVNYRDQEHNYSYNYTSYIGELGVGQ